MPASPSQYIFGIQAIPLLVSAVFSLLWPVATSEFPATPMQGLSTDTIQAMSLTSLALGTFQVIAAYQNNIPMMTASVFGRLLAAFTFSQSDNEVWRGVAPFEAFMGILTGVGIYWDWHRKRSAGVAGGQKWG